MICVNLHNSYLKVDNVVIWWLATISRPRDLVGFERWEIKGGSGVDGDLGMLEGMK